MKLLRFNITNVFVKLFISLSFIMRLLPATETTGDDTKTKVRMCEDFCLHRDK